LFFFSFLFLKANKNFCLEEFFREFIEEKRHKIGTIKKPSIILAANSFELFYFNLLFEKIIC
jgi:hypothetical protein